MAKYMEEVEKGKAINDGCRGDVRGASLVRRRMYFPALAGSVLVPSSSFYSFSPILTPHTVQDTQYIEYTVYRIHSTKHTSGGSLLL